MRLESIKEGIGFDNRQNLQTKAMIVFFGLFAESKRDLIVERAKVGSGSTQDAR